MSKKSRNPEELLERLEWTMLKRLDGLLQGEYRTLLRGAGLDLADLREYAYGDDVRRIDWNVTARLQTPHVREYIEDRDVTAWFLCDLTPSIDFGSDERDKREVLVEFVALMARLLSRRGNRVGAMLFDGTSIRLIPARGGRVNVLMLIRELQQETKRDESPPTKLSTLIEAADRIVRRRSMVFLVSDFFSEPGWEAPLAILARRHDVLGIRLYDPMEVELPNIGLVTMADAETGGPITVDTGSRELRRRFAEVAAAHVNEVHETLERSHVDVLDLSTDDELVEALVRLVLQRKRAVVQRGRVS